MRLLHRAPLLKLAGRFALAIGLLLTLNQLYGKTLMEALLPLLRWELVQLDDTYRILDLSLEREGRDTVIRLNVGLERAVVIGGRVLMPDPRARANVSTLAAHLAQPAILCLALVLAWPTKRVIEYPLRGLIACVGIALTLVSDVPFVLWAELWNLHVSAFEPDRFSPLLIWKDFLQAGGRYLLGLIGGVLSVWCAAVLSA